jgi:ADP-sugar diphosphatase
VYQTIEIGKRTVPVIFPGSILDEMFDEEKTWKKIIDFKPFMDYCARMDERFDVKIISIQSITMFGSRIGFMEITAVIFDKDLDHIPGVVVLRGVSVAILIILRDETGKEYVVIARQPRAATGEYDFPEIPAGMLDGQGNVAGKAVEEAKEETGLTIEPSELIDLTALAYGEGCPGVHVSPGFTDELFRFFACEKTMAGEDIKLLNNRLTGLRDKGEKITIEIVPIQEACRIPDVKTALALMLYMNFKDQGVIK